jgi:hypothetical protein
LIFAYKRDSRPRSGKRGYPIFELN